MLGALVDILLKYVAMVPAYAVLLALAAMAVGAIRAHRGER